MTASLPLHSADPGPGPNKRGYMSYVVGPFDYGVLAADLAEETRAAAVLINGSKRNHIIEVGLELLKMKERLARGHFTDWIDRELNFSSATARNYMAAAREFADAPLTFSVLPPSLLYRLAGTTPEVREGIVSRFEAGEYVDREEVDDAVRRPKRETAEAKRLAAEQAQRMPQLSVAASVATKTCKSSGRPNRKSDRIARQLRRGS